MKFVPGIKARDLVNWADGGAHLDTIARDVALRTEEALERNQGYMKPLTFLQPCCVVLFGTQGHHRGSTRSPTDRSLMTNTPTPSTPQPAFPDPLREVVRRDNPFPAPQPPPTERK